MRFSIFFSSHYLFIILPLLHFNSIFSTCHSIISFFYFLIVLCLANYSYGLLFIIVQLFLFIFFHFPHILSIINSFHLPFFYPGVSLYSFVYAIYFFLSFHFHSFSPYSFAHSFLTLISFLPLYLPLSFILSSLSPSFHYTKLLYSPCHRISSPSILYLMHPFLFTFSFLSLLFLRLVFCISPSFLLSQHPSFFLLTSRPTPSPLPLSTPPSSALSMHLLKSPLIPPLRCLAYLQCP